MSASPGVSAVQLPWLAPDAAALAACSRGDPSAIQSALESDPGFALLWARSGALDPAASASLAQLLRFAVAQLQRPRVGVLESSHSATRRILRVSRQLAQAAAYRARESGQVDAVRAAVAGLLAPLGWFATAASQPDLVERCLADADFVHDPEGVQQRLWGVTAASLSRRLAREWALPEWLATAIGNLDLSAELAQQVGGDPALTAIVHDAVARQPADPLRLANGRAKQQGEAIAAADLEHRTDPYSAPFLSDLLEFALEQHQNNPSAVTRLLERENDALRRALREQAALADERLQSQKLAALAEFAAGAGHEINNPLAVISGHAQYLLVKESEPDRQKSLQSVVHQAQRIHHILTDLMQFARPSKPFLRNLDLREAAHAVATEMHEFAALQRVRIELLTPDDPCLALADGKHVHVALQALLRNAIEAAPADGWARISVEASGDVRRIAVEDSGIGPAHHQRDHLFDPFYSGRQAGRGRGLGLPTAWRLAQEQGGDVTFEPTADSPARFVLSLSRAHESISAERLSA